MGGRMILQRSASLACCAGGAREQSCTSSIAMLGAMSTMRHLLQESCRDCALHARSYVHQIGASVPVRQQVSQSATEVYLRMISRAPAVFDLVSSFLVSCVL